MRGNTMKVYAVIDIRSRWFELYSTAEDAQTRADQMNANLGSRYRTARYHVTEVHVHKAEAEAE
jgi:hypothetical protein